MDDHLKAFVDSKFSIPPLEGEDKVCSLEEAVKRYVQPGMSLHFAGRSGALFYQLVREFWGKKADFTVISPCLTELLIVLIRGNLIKKAVTSYTGNAYPTLCSNPLVQKAYISGMVEFENWTMLTISQRLLAGAMGWDFIPTRSLIGSSMAEENREYFKVIESPFGSGEKLGLMKALHPDITFVHALAADRSGNTILTYPLGMDAYGAWASKKGVIMSVEHVVPADYIRSYSHLVRIPSYMVKAVCEVPYGAHPWGLPNFGVPQFEGYFDDYDFVETVREASMAEDKFMNFIQEWILDCHDHGQYIGKVGREHLRYLHDKAKQHSWVVETLNAVPHIEFNRESNSLERMVIAGGRYLVELCRQRGYQTMLCGAGFSNLSAWLASYTLKEMNCDVALVTETGMYGYLPRPSDPTVSNMHNMYSCKMLTNVETALGVLAGGSTNTCLGVLTMAQVDKYGNANSTKIPGVYYIGGSGGANDVASTCRETVVFATAGKERLLENVPYITFPGDRVKALITDVGIFEKLGNQDTFSLTAYMPYATALKADEAVRDIRKLVSWELEVAPHLRKIDLPSYEEKMLVRLFDPRGYFTRASR